MDGITFIAGPSLVGALFDTTGSYLAGFLAVGGLGLLGALILPLVHCHQPEDHEGGENVLTPCHGIPDILMSSKVGWKGKWSNGVGKKVK